MKEQIKKIDPKLAPTKALYKRAENPTIGLVILVQIVFYEALIYMYIYY